MKIKITLILLMSFSFVFSQKEIPDKEELLGNWTMFVKDYLAEVREYVLIKSDSDDYYEKIHIEKDRIAKTYNTKGIRCGNDHRSYYNRSYKYRKTSWVYNEKDGILEISERHVLYGKLFLVKKIDSGRIVLTQIK